MTTLFRLTVSRSCIYGPCILSIFVYPYLARLCLLLENLGKARLVYLPCGDHAVSHYKHAVS